MQVYFLFLFLFSFFIRLTHSFMPAPVALLVPAATAAAVGAIPPAHPLSLFLSFPANPDLLYIFGS